MAFKMKGSPMARNYGAPFEKNEEGNPLEEAKSTNKFQQDSSLEKEMKLAQGKVSVISNSRYATPEQKAADLRHAQKGVDALNNQGYFKAKANHASSAMKHKLKKAALHEHADGSAHKGGKNYPTSKEPVQLLQNPKK
jgi:hypothetical protein